LDFVEEIVRSGDEVGTLDEEEGFALGVPLGVLVLLTLAARELRLEDFDAGEDIL
jgi:hypothetical protein